MEKTKRNTSAKAARKTVKKEEEVVPVNTYDMQDVKSRVGVKTFDKTKGYKYRWTRTAGRKAEEEGKFVLVGIRPKKLSNSVAPPFIGASTVKKVMIKELDELNRYNDENIILTTLDLSELVANFPEYYEEGTEPGYQMPIYIVGQLDAVVEQLILQNVISANLASKKTAIDKLRKWLWGTSVTVSEFPTWVKSKTFKQILDRNPPTKKTEEIGQVDPEKVYKILALAKLMKIHKVQVLDVNGVVVCKYGQKPKRSVNNTFGDAVLAAILRDEDKNDDFSLNRMMFNISGMANIMFPFVKSKKDPAFDKNGKKRNTELIAHNTAVFKVEGLTGLVFVPDGANDESIDLSSKIYSNNPEAIAAFIKEIKAVNEGAVQGFDDRDGPGYSYKEPRQGIDALKTDFAQKLADISASRHVDKAPKDNMVVPAPKQYDEILGIEDDDDDEEDTE